MHFLPNFVDLFSILSYFQRKYQKFFKPSAQPHILSFTCATFKRINKQYDQHEKQEKTYFPVMKICYLRLSRPPNLPLQFNRSSVVKLKTQTIFRHLYSEARGPKCVTWLQKFYTACVIYQTTPTILRLATVVSVPKPGNAADD